MTDLLNSTMLADAVESARDLGSRVMRSVTTLVDRVGKDTKALTQVARTTTSCSCARRRRAFRAPQRELLPVVSQVCPGGTPRVVFKIHNCGLADRHVFVVATGADAGMATGAPSATTIGALDTAELAAEVTLPSGTDHADLILWVRGCSDTAVHWTVSASDKGCNTTHQIAIDDCPGTQHHWYDHFASRPVREPRSWLTASARSGDAALDLNVRYYEAWGRVANEYVRDLGATLKSYSPNVRLPTITLPNVTTATATTSNSAPVHSTPQPASRPIVLLEAAPGSLAEGAVLVEDHLAHPVSAGSGRGRL